MQFTYLPKSINCLTHELINAFGHFCLSFNIGALVVPFFGTAVKSAKHKKVAPGIKYIILIGQKIQRHYLGP